MLGQTVRPRRRSEVVTRHQSEEGRAGCKQAQDEVREARLGVARD